jgi:hypothetical protein
MAADINISVGIDQNSINNMRKMIERSLNNLSFSLSQRSLIVAQKDIAEKVRPTIKFEADQRSLNSLTRQVSKGMGQIKLGFTVTQEQRKSIRDLIQRETKNIAVDFSNADIRKLADSLKGISKINLNITNTEFKAFEDKVRSHFEKAPLVIRAQIRPVGYEQLRKDANALTGGSKGGRGNNNKNTIGGPNQPNNNNNKYNDQLKDTAKSTKDVKDKTEEATKAVSSFAERIGFTTSRLAAYLVPATAIFQLGNFFSAAGSSISQINADVNKLTQILDGNAEAAKNVADQVFQLAQRYGQSGKDLLDVASTLAQAGDQFGGNKLLSAVEALSRTKLAATFGDIKDTTEGAIAALNQFQLEGNQLNDVLDVTNQLAKKFAFESSNLFEAVRTGGASFSVAGGDIKDFASAVTAVRQLTRLSPSTIGVGLNTISQRSLRPEIVRFQESLTRNVGGIRDFDGNLLGIVDRWKQIAKATKNYSDEELQPVVEKMSDIRQGKIFLPLLRDLQRGGDGSVFLKALEESQKSAGSLIRDTEIGLNRIDVQIASVGAKFEEVFKNLSQDRGLQNLIKDFAGIAKAAAGMLDVITPLVPILIKLGTIKLASGIFKGFPDFIKGITTPQDKRGIPGSPGNSLGDLLPLSAIIKKSGSNIVAKGDGRTLRKITDTSNKEYLRYGGALIPIDRELAENQRLLESGLLDITGQKNAARQTVTSLRRRGTNVAGTLGLRDQAQAALTKVLFAPRGFSQTGYFGPNEGGDVVQQFTKNALHTNSDLVQRARNKLILDQASETYRQRVRGGAANDVFAEEYQKVLRGAGTQLRAEQILKSGKIDPQFLKQIVSKGTEDKALNALYHVPKSGGLERSTAQVPTGLSIEEALLKSASQRELQRAALLQAQQNTNPLTADEILKVSNPRLNSEARNASYRRIYEESLTAARQKYANYRPTTGDLSDAAGLKDFGRANTEVLKREERIKAVLEGRIRQYGRSLENTTGTTEDLRKTQKNLARAAERATGVYSKLGSEQKDVLNNLDEVKQARFARINKLVKDLEFIDANTGVRGFVKRSKTNLGKAAQFGLNHFAEAFSLPVALALQSGSNQYASKVGAITNSDGQLINNYQDVIKNNRFNTVRSSKLGGASTGALLGAQAGLAAGPIGALVGLVGGALVGSIFGGVSGNKEALANKRAGFGNASSSAATVRDAALPTLELIRSLKTESSGSLRSNLKRFDDTDAGKADTQGFKSRLDTELHKLVKANPNLGARELKALAGTSLTAQYAKEFSRLGDQTAQADANKYVVDKLKRLGQAADESADKILHEGKIRSALVSQIDKDFGKGKSLIGYGIDLRRSTNDINLSTGFQGVQNQYNQGLNGLLGGNASPLKIPDNFGQLLGQNIIQQVTNLTGDNRSDISHIISQNSGGLLSNQEVGVFTDTQLIQKRLDTFIQDALKGVAGKIIEENAEGFGTALTGQLDKYFGGNFKSGIQDEGTRNDLNNRLQQLRDELDKSPQLLQEDPEGIIKKFLGPFADGTIFMEKIVAKLANVNAGLEKQDLEYQRRRGFETRGLQYETQGVNQQIARARASEAIGFTSEQIIGELDKVIGKTNNGFNLRGAAGGVTAIANGLSTKTSDFTKEELENSRKYIAAQDKFADAIARSTNVVNALRAKFDEVSKVINNITGTNKNLSGLSTDQRFEQEANFNLFQGYIKSILPQLGGAGNFAGFVNTHSDAEVKGFVRSLSGFAGNEQFQQALTAGDLFGSRRLAPNLTSSGAVDILRNAIGASVADPTGKDLDELIRNIREQADLFDKSYNIEDEQLFYLKQINDALRSRFGYSITQYDNNGPANNGTSYAQAVSNLKPIPFSSYVQPSFVSQAYDAAKQQSESGQSKTTDQYGNGAADINQLSSSIVSLNTNIQQLIDKQNQQPVVKLDGSLNITGFENTGKDITVKAIVTSVMTTFRDQLGTSALEQELRQKLDLAIRQLNQ